MVTNLVEHWTKMYGLDKRTKVDNTSFSTWDAGKSSGKLPCKTTLIFNLECFQTFGKNPIFFTKENFSKLLIIGEYKSSRLKYQILMWTSTKEPGASLWKKHLTMTAANRTNVQFQ